MKREEILSRIFFALRMKGKVSSKKNFASAIDFNYSCLSAAFSGEERYLTDNLFRRIEHTFPELNRDFIWKGEGSIFTDTPISPQLNELLDSAVAEEMEANKQNIGRPAAAEGHEGNDETTNIALLLTELGEQREMTKRAQANMEKALAQIDQLIEIIKNVATRQ